MEASGRLIVSSRSSAAPSRRPNEGPGEAEPALERGSHEHARGARASRSAGIKSKAFKHCQGRNQTQHKLDLSVQCEGFGVKKAKRCAAVASWSVHNSSPLASSCTMGGGL